MRLGHNLHETRSGTVEVDENLVVDSLALGCVLGVRCVSSRSLAHLLNLQLVNSDVECPVHPGLASLETQLAAACDGVWALGKTWTVWLAHCSAV